jgi:hypothetical protein
MEGTLNVKFLNPEYEVHQVCHVSRELFCGENLKIRKNTITDQFHQFRFGTVFFVKCSKSKRFFVRDCIKAVNSDLKITWIEPYSLVIQILEASLCL